MTNKFPHTRKALAEYDRTQYVRDMLLDRANTDKHVKEWEEACAAALLEVQCAFFEDTKHVNSMDHCKHASISWMRSLL